MTDPAAYKVDSLFLLIGGNPLPNYVAARVLAHKDTQIILVCSSDTRDEAAKRLAQLLRAEGFQHLKHCEVEEANPRDIRNQVTQRLSSLTGTTIGLHYTGGTKAMSVHAYLAIRDAAQRSVQYSYLDARTLALHIEQPHDKGLTLPDVGMLLDPPLSIKALLELHDLDEMKQPMKLETTWPDQAMVLAEWHTDDDQVQTWRTWCYSTLRNKDGLLDTTILRGVSISDIPIGALREAFLRRYGDLDPTNSLVALAEKAGMPLKKNKKHLAKWFDGDWLEQYVMHKLKPLRENGLLHELVMTLNPDLKETDFEFDVAGMRGYQLFAFSVSTDSGKGLLKSKLLEAVVRAEQMGGSETRVALVCCANSKTVVKLESEIRTLFRQRQLTKVFGQADLLDLDAKVADWIMHAHKKG